MKALLFSALIALTATTAFAQDAVQLATQAQAEYAQRGPDNTGISHAQAAADLYEKAAAVAADSTVKAADLFKRAEALYFVGNATQPREAKIDRHLKGMQAADEGLKLLGFTDIGKITDTAVQAAYAKLNKAQQDMVADGLYQRGINLGSWGTANGVVDSLSKWPDLRRSMEIIVLIGQKTAHDFGANRVLGRGYFKIPSLLGGNMKKATALMKEAVEGTKVAGQIYSHNGFNNVYYAEILKENGDDDQAVALLQAYIAADLSLPDFKDIVPETKELQREASELLKSW